VDVLYQNTGVVAATLIYTFPIRAPDSLCDFRVPFASPIDRAAAPSEFNHDETLLTPQRAIDISFFSD
jgi:hypothetical protein